MTVVESTRKAVLWDDGSRFIVGIGVSKKNPPPEPLWRRDTEGQLILKGSTWRFPYQNLDKEEMEYHARNLYNIHA